SSSGKAYYKISSLPPQYINWLNIVFNEVGTSKTLVNTLANTQPSTSLSQSLSDNRNRAFKFPSSATPSIHLSPWTTWTHPGRARPTHKHHTPQIDRASTRRQHSWTRSRLFPKSTFPCHYQMNIANPAGPSEEYSVTRSPSLGVGSDDGVCTLSSWTQERRFYNL
ncbi:hypothetical protein EV363DRAFT_1487146, partial [Boletus edulis]